MFEHKLVAVLNQNLEHGVAMNALAHMTLGLGDVIPSDQMRLDTYHDANENTYPNISQIPFIILGGKGTKIRELVKTMRTESEVKFGVFLNTMTQGTYIEQLARTKETPEESLEYYGAVLFGPWTKVSELTKKFSLWK